MDARGRIAAVSNDVAVQMLPMKISLPSTKVLYLRAAVTRRVWS